MHEQDDAISLLELPVGCSARIALPRSGDSIPSRLEDLGFVPGTSLRVVRRAPFGDPIELEIRGYRLCLRAEQIVGLRVEPERADRSE
jgi:ferrous iron transport protein A